MANRNYKPGAMAIEKGLICLYGRVVIGAAGAIASQDCRGFSIASDGSSAYTITLEDNYNALYMVSSNVIDAVAAGEGKFVQITSEDVTTATIAITTVASDDGLAADIAADGILLLEITLKNSTVKY
jgi:hypothetical protein